MSFEQIAFFFIFAKCPLLYARPIRKTPRSQDFFLFKKKFKKKKFFLASFLIPIGSIIFISFYNIDWYIIYSITLPFCFLIEEAMFREQKKKFEILVS